MMDKHNRPDLRVVGTWCDDYCYDEAEAQNAYLCEIGRLAAARHPAIKLLPVAGFMVRPELMPVSVEFCPRCHAYHLRRTG